MNYKQLYAIKRDLEKKVQTHNSKITHDSGIYAFERTVNYVYVGQSKDLLNRTVSHLQGYEQHIDLSLKKHGIYSNQNPAGWRVDVLEKCEECDLDGAERRWIEYYNTSPVCELLNITDGGQGKGKADIGQRKAVKGYQDGKKAGRDKILKEINERLVKGDIRLVIDKPNKIKEKHLAKLYEILGVNYDKTDG